MKKFNPSSSHPERAVQAWQILVGCAMNRQTITYSDLAGFMYRRQGRKGAGVLAQILGHLAAFCDANGLPELNAIVVGKRRGTPGRSIPLDVAKVDNEREKIYRCDWYNLVPPSASELKAAWDRWVTKH